MSRNPRNHGELLMLLTIRKEQIKLLEAEADYYRRTLDAIARDAARARDNHDVTTTQEKLIAISNRLKGKL